MGEGLHGNGGTITSLCTMALSGKGQGEELDDPKDAVPASRRGSSKITFAAPSPQRSAGNIFPRCFASLRRCMSFLPGMIRR